MRVRFTAVHLVGGQKHEHIHDLKAVGPNGERYEQTRELWVAFIEKGNSGYVHDIYGNEVAVYVNHNAYTKWIQTYADGKWTDNLLALPKY